MKSWVWMLFLALTSVVVFSACATDRVRAMETAARHWRDAKPGKNYEVQVVDAQKTADRRYRVRSRVDGVEKLGIYDPGTETFTESRPGAEE